MSSYILECVCCYNHEIQAGERRTAVGYKFYNTILLQHNSSIIALSKVQF